MKFGSRFSYELSDKQQGDIRIQIFHKGTDAEEVTVIGNLVYVGPDGKEHSVKYVVDRDGFRLIQQQIHVEPSVLKSLIG